MRSPREVVETYYRSLEEGDFDAVVALHAPDLTCWMSGESIVSGRFEGREKLYEHMGRHVLGPLVVGGESYVKAARVVLDDGPYVAGLFRGGLPNRSGGRYDQHYLQCFRIEDGLIQEIVEFFDTVMFEQAVLGHALETPRAAPATPFEIGAAGNAAESRGKMVSMAGAFVSRACAGDLAGLVPLLAEGAELAVPGATPHSGVARFEPARLAAILAGGLDATRLVCADAGAALLLAKAADPAYRQQYGLLLEADAARIGRVTLFEDTALAEAHLYGDRLTPQASRSIKPRFNIAEAFGGGPARGEA